MLGFVPLMILVRTSIIYSSTSLAVVGSVLRVARGSGSDRWSESLPDSHVAKVLHTAAATAAAAAAAGHTLYQYCCNTLWYT